MENKEREEEVIRIPFAEEPTPEQLLERFMKEHFPYAECKKIGLFTKEMRNNYKAQAQRVCDYFGYETVYEYGSEEVRCHISYAGERPLSVNDAGKMVTEPFVTVFPSIYE